MNSLRIDQYNLILLVAAFLAAYVVPFEVLLLSYAFLGPLHYLTEISWLHDRKYFSLGQYDPFILTVASLSILFLGAALLPGSAELIWILFVFAFCAAFIASWLKRALILTASFFLLLPLLGTTASFTLAVLIPTVIHVFLFTLFFMILGALRSGSKLGYFNAGLFFMGSIVLLVLPTSDLVLWPSFVESNYIFFSGIAEAVARFMTYESNVVIAQMASFLAFAYTYHYLNWFSKTTIIEWHRISAIRSFLIGFCYALAVGLYIYDYGLGLTVLLSLSFLHVILEFPLNFKSMAGIGTALASKWPFHR